MECCAEPQRVNSGLSARVVRQSFMTELSMQCMKLRGGKYVMGMNPPHEHNTIAKEITSEALELPSGGLLWANRITHRYPQPIMPINQLASCLRETFKQLGITGDVVELDKGVWVSDATLDNIVAWSDRQALNEEVLKWPELNDRNSHFSSGPRKFAMTFDKIAKAQERGVAA